MYINKGYPIDALYLDSQKAFNKVPHYRLLSKIKAHGIDHRVVQCIKSWLSCRQERAVLNGEMSDWSLVKIGVPQVQGQF